MTCRNYRPDHNGECLNCDEPADEHLDFLRGEVERLQTDQKMLATVIRNTVVALADVPDDWEGSVDEGVTLINANVLRVDAALTAYDALRDHMAAEQRCDFPEHLELMVDLATTVRSLTEARAEIEDFRRSFDLYHTASMALMRLYKAAHREVPENVWPDTAAVNEWAAEELVTLRADRDFWDKKAGDEHATLQTLASAMRKVLPPKLLTEVIAHLDPLTPFVAFLQAHDQSPPDK